MPLITLTVQPTSGEKKPIGLKTYRLGISLEDSLELFKEGGIKVNVKLANNNNVPTKTTCGPPLKKGFDLYHANINTWITAKGFQNYKPHHPTKLEFNYAIIIGVIVLTFVRKLP
jgi:hypothetical protein